MILCRPPAIHYRVIPAQTVSFCDTAVVLHDLSAIFSRLTIHDDSSPCPRRSSEDYTPSHRLCLINSTFMRLAFSVLSTSRNPPPFLPYVAPRQFRPPPGRPIPPTIRRSQPPPRAWATHLIGLGLIWYQLQHPSITPLAELILHSPSLRSLHLACFPTELLRVLADVLRERPHQLKPQRLELIHWARVHCESTPHDLAREDLKDFVAAFYDSLEHFYLHGIRIAEADGMDGMMRTGRMGRRWNGGPSLQSGRRGWEGSSHWVCRGCCAR